MNIVLANKTCIVPRSPVIFLLAWRFSPKRHLTPRGHILPAFVCFCIFVLVLQFVLSTGGRRGTMELLHDNHSHVVYVRGCPGLFLGTESLHSRISVHVNIQPNGDSFSFPRYSSVQAWFGYFILPGLFSFFRVHDDNHSLTFGESL